MKNLSLKLSSTALNGLEDMISHVLTDTKPVDLEDKLLLSVLQRLHKRLIGKTYDAKQENTLLLSADEALALAIINERLDLDVTTQMGNSLHLLTNQIHQQFN